MSNIQNDTYRKDPIGSFTASGQTLGPFDVSEFNSILLMMQGTYTLISIAWEGSMDGVNWTGIQGVRTDSGTAETTSGSLASTVRAWDIYVGPFNYFRVRSTAWSSGNAEIWMACSECGVNTAIVATIAGAVSVGGNTVVIGPSGQSSTLSLNPVAVGGQVFSIPDTTMVNNDACYLTMTTARQVITKDFGSAESDWQFTAGGLTTTTTAAAAAAARAANVRNYVTALQAINTSAVATRLLIQDGATTIFQVTLPANMTQAEKIVFPTPLRGSGATALNYNFSVAGATVDLNIQGFQSF